MSTGHVDATIKAAVLANTVFDAVSDAAAINAYYNDLGNKVDGNYDEAHPNNIASVGLYRIGSTNGSMMINQRGVTSSNLIASGASAYTLDRIKSVNLGSGVNAQAFQTGVTDLNGSSKGLIMVHTGSIPSAQGKLSHVYTMEAQDAYRLAGQQVTFQVQVSSFQGMNQVTLNARYKTTESAISNSSTLIGTSGAIVISVGAWTLVTLTVTLPSRATLTTTGVIGIEIIASKTTAEASSDGFIITCLDWNLGSTALPFQPKSYNEELTACQRFYENSYADGAAVGTADGYDQMMGSLVAADTSSLLGSLSFKVRKRVNPTITLRAANVATGSGTLNNVRDDSVGGLLSISGCTFLKSQWGIRRITLGGFVANHTYAFSWEADAEL